MRKTLALLLWLLVIMAAAPYWYDVVFPLGPQGRPGLRIEGLVASFTATAASGKLAANQTDFIWYFDLSNAPAAFWAAVDDDGATVRVFDVNSNRRPAHVVSFDADDETGWLAWRADGLATSDNEFTIDTDGSFVAPDAQFGSESVWSNFTAVQMFGEVWDDATGTDYVEDGAEPGLWNQVSESGNLGIHQGVAWDGTFYYVSDTNELKKYNSSFTLQATNSDPVGDTGVSGMSHIGDLTTHDGVIYAFVSDFPTKSKNHVAKYNTSDLSFIESFDIFSEFETGAGLYYNPDDDLLYGIDQSGTTDEISKIDPVTESVTGTIALSESLSAVGLNGITKLGDRFYVTATTSTKGVLAIDEDGTVHPVPVYTQFEGSESVGGLDTKGDNLIVLFDYAAGAGGAGRVKEIEVRPGIDMGLGHACRFLAFGNVFPTLRGVPSLTELTLGVTVLYETGGTGNTAFASYVNEAAPEGNNDQIRFGQESSVWSVWDPNNLWLNGTEAPSAAAAIRLNYVYSGTTHRKIYVDGALDASEIGISDPGYSDFLSLMLAREDAGEFSLYKGQLGFLYLYPGELDASWIEDEHEQLSDNANFWGVEDTTDAVLITVGFDAFVKDTGPPPKDNAVGVQFNAFVTDVAGGDDPVLGGTGRNLLKRFSGRHIGKPVQ